MLLDGFGKITSWIRKKRCLASNFLYKLTVLGPSPTRGLFLLLAEKKKMIVS